MNPAYPPCAPQIMQHTNRVDLANRLAEKLRAHYTGALLALGIYGSLARGSDGPYSDIEMFCILSGKEIDTSYEWSAGPWKAEIDVLSPDVFLSQAAEFSGHWSISHGSFTRVSSLYDPQGLFQQAAALAVEHTPDEISRLVKEIAIGDIYELVGKLRNARAINRLTAVPVYAVHLLQYAACLAGVWNRHLYTTSATMYEEALALPDLPAGFAGFVRLVTGGKLDDTQAVSDAADRLWSGIEEWAAARQIRLVDDLDELFRAKSNE